MLIRSQKKTHPCEGCRERKKKCSGEYPCTRCHRLGNECVFLQPTLPPDHAYVGLLQEQELSLQVETLNSALLEMERTMIQLRRNTSGMNNSNDDNHNRQQLTSRRTNKNSTQQRQNEQQQHMMIQNWQLILGKHGVTVNTCIKSYSDLLQQAELWQQACQSPPLFRSPSSTFSTSMVLHRQLPLWLLRRGYYLAVTICIKSQQNIDHSSGPTTTTTTNIILSSSQKHHMDYPPSSQQQQQPSPPVSEHEYDNDTTLFPLIEYDDPDKLCRRILDIFFSCYIIRSTVLHQSTFYRLFVTPISSSLLDSPVICSVCAVALTLRCRHMLPGIPYQHQAQMAEMLYRRARDLLDFDEPSLATLIVLTFLAWYKELLFCVDDASFYLDMAYRTRYLVVDDDDDDNDNDDDDDEKRGERELIKRLHWALWEVQTSVEYYKNQRGVPQSTKTSTSSTPRTPNSSITTLMTENRHRYKRQPLPDESPMMHQALQMTNYRSEMMATQGSFLRQVRFGSKDTIDVNLLAETEYRFNKYYFQDVPVNCRLPSNVMEQGLSDDEFRKRLDTLWPCEHDTDDDGDNRLGILNLAVQYFQGIISLYESFLPDLNDRQRARDIGLLKDDGDTPCFTGGTSAAATNATSSSESNNDSKVTMHQLRAQQKCTHAATTIVRLLDYQRNLRGHCTLNVHILLTAWDIHMRNACLGLTVPSLSQDENNTTDDDTMYFQCLSLKSIHQARHSLLQCLSILREGYFYNFAEHAVWKYYDYVEQQLMSCLYGTSPSTAPVPAPVAHWIPCSSP